MPGKGSQHGVPMKSCAAGHARMRGVRARGPRMETKTIAWSTCAAPLYQTGQLSGLVRVILSAAITSMSIRARVA